MNKPKKSNRLNVTPVEWGLLAALVAVVMIAVVTALLPPTKTSETQSIESTLESHE